MKNVFLNVSQVTENFLARKRTTSCTRSELEFHRTLSSIYCESFVFCFFFLVRFLAIMIVLAYLREIPLFVFFFFFVILFFYAGTCCKTISRYIRSFIIYFY